MTEEFYDIQTNPVTKTKKFHHDRQTQYVPPEKDVLKLLAACTRRERVFLLCYLRTGARKGEIFALKWDEDINFENKQIRLSTRKTKDGNMKHVWLPMETELYDGLLWLFKTRLHPESPYVWTIPEGPYAGRHYSYRHKFLKGLCKRAEVREIKFHSLRRYFASILKDRVKASTPTIQRLLRHENISTTEGYIYDLHTDLRATLEALSGPSLSVISTTSAREPTGSGG